MKKLPSSLALALLLSACDLGLGSKLETVEITTATGASITGSHQAYLCFRDRLNVIGRFTDGSVGNFSTRVLWSSSNPAVVQVLNNSEQNTRAVFSNDNGATVGFNNINNSFYTAGVIVPKSAGNAEITATFLGITAKVTVNVKAPQELAVSPNPIITGGAVNAATGVGFFNSFTVRAKLDKGQVIDAISRRNDPVTLELLNPILWQFGDNNPAPFPVGSFKAGRSTSANSLDREDLNVFPNNTNRTFVEAPAQAGNESANLGPATGLLRGVVASAPTVQAVFDTAQLGAACAAVPLAALNVPVKAVAGLTLRHEANFNGPGVTNGDLVVNTDEFLQTIADLGAPDTQDVSTQVGYEVVGADRDVCVPNTDCSMAANRISSILSFISNRLVTVPGTDGSFDLNNNNLDTNAGAPNPAFNGDAIVNAVRVRSCAPAPCSVTSTRFSDGGNFAAPNLANTLPIRAVPATLDGYDAVAVSPAGTLMQAAFTFPGAQYSVFGNFKSATNSFAGGANGKQNVSRYMSWLPRPENSTTEISPLLTLFGLYVSTFNSGQTYYLRNPTAITKLDITATPATSTLIGNFANASTLAAPVKAALTVNPS